MRNKRDVRGAGRHVGSDRTVDLIGDGFAQRAILDGELHMHGYVDDAVTVLIDGAGRHGLDRRDHAQIGDGTAQFRVDDMAESFENIRFDGVNVVHDPPVCAYHLSGWSRATPEPCSAACIPPRIIGRTCTGNADGRINGVARICETKTENRYSSAETWFARQISGST